MYLHLIVAVPPGIPTRCSSTRTSCLCVGPWPNSSRLDPDPVAFHATVDELIARACKDRQPCLRFMVRTSGSRSAQQVHGDYFSKTKVGRIDAVSSRHRV